jgi:hypothetical protein
MPQRTWAADKPGLRQRRRPRSPNNSFGISLFPPSEATNKQLTRKRDLDQYLLDLYEFAREKFGLLGKFLPDRRHS